MPDTELQKYEILDYRSELFKKNGRWFIRFPDLPGCIADGDTREEALVQGDEAKALWLETALETGREVPTPSEEPPFSGKLVLRLGKGVHADSALCAQRESISLNTYLVQAAIEKNQRTAFKTLLNEFQAQFQKLARSVDLHGGAARWQLKVTLQRVGEGPEILSKDDARQMSVAAEAGERG